MPQPSRNEGSKTFIADKYTWNCAVYLRLSKDDGDKVESDSIANQRAYVINFLESQPDIRVHKVLIDDGYSGVDFNRPAFIEMIEDIRAGTVNCVAVKDFSRLGRNYIETGKYIQLIFPSYKVRFIAVSDNYDSDSVQGFMGNIIVPFKNLVNDAYCADISMKVRSHLEVKRKKGDFVGAFAVYGYTKDGNKLIPDPFAADIVRDIYKWKIDGISAQGIADKLNQRGVLSPMEYKRFLGMSYATTFKVHATAKWQAVSVRRILTNAVYTGILEQGKSSKPNYKIRKPIALPKDKWVRIENAHEPIIHPTVFNTVQELLKQDTRAVKQGDAVAPLSGIIVCGDCGGAMVRKSYKQNNLTRAYYICSMHRADKSFCSTHTVLIEDCENAVSCTLRLHALAAIGAKDDAKDGAKDAKSTLGGADAVPAENPPSIAGGFAKGHTSKLTAQIEAKESEINQLCKLRMSLFEGFCNGVLAEDDFISFKEVYDKKITDAESAIRLLQEEINKIPPESPTPDTLTHSETLPRRLTIELVGNVSVHENRRITITLRYADVFPLDMCCYKRGKFQR